MIEYATSIKYMFAGYAVILTVLALYIVSLFIRWHNLKRDLQTLKEIQKKN
ncbi:MAG: hypothetical protein NTW99_01010 [Chloroflexi bacterium]|nr:hypothetical protein [Chloroflexota bacterium]